MKSRGADGVHMSYELRAFSKGNLTISEITLLDPKCRLKLDLEPILFCGLSVAGHAHRVGHSWVTSSLL